MGKLMNALVKRMLGKYKWMGGMDKRMGRSEVHVATDPSVTENAAMPPVNVMIDDIAI
jgi:hypothetical protein